MLAIYYKQGNRFSIRMGRILLVIVSIFLVVSFFGIHCHGQTGESADDTQSTCKADESDKMEICKHQGKLK